MNEIIVKETSNIVKYATDALKKDPQVVVVVLATTFLIYKAIDKYDNIDVDVSANDIHISLKTKDKSFNAIDI